MSPRRSSRARIAGPGPLPTNGSSSNGRSERSTRSNNKRDTSSAQRSLSREGSANGQGDALASRRSKRGAEVDNDEIAKTTLDDDEEEEAEAEEVTRCTCGLAEYPGPPLHHRDERQRSAKTTVKDENGTPAATGGVEGSSDDAGNFFIQCDQCQVWQHGGCVGLMDESLSPDEYFCEQCKPQFHKVVRGPHSSKWTRYQPVQEAESSRSSSTSSGEVARRKEAKQKAIEASTRRRATMNSREAAYDEEEMMRRAIEESKLTSGTLGKRNREESEEKLSNSKRVRTSSGSPEAKASPSPSQHASEDEEESKSGVNGSLRKVRGAAARVQREKETRDKQKEADRQKKEEAASRRNARSERRRGEDTPPPTPSLSPSKQESKVSAAPPPKPSQPDTPSSQRPNSANTVRKTGRPARKGRIRNQYTRDAPANGEESPSGDVSSGGQGSPQGGHIVNGDSGRPSRAKHINPTRTSMNEMKRRVAGIIEFVSRLQTETPGSPGRNGNTPNGIAPDGSSTANGSPSSSKDANSDPENFIKAFRQLSSVEMMEELMRSSLNWQTTYGKYGEK